WNCCVRSWPAAAAATRRRCSMHPSTPSPPGPRPLQALARLLLTLARRRRAQQAATPAPAANGQKVSQQGVREERCGLSRRGGRYPPSAARQKWESRVMLHSVSEKSKSSDSAAGLTLGPEQVAAWLRLFFEPGQVTELRALGVERRGGWTQTEAGFY